MPGDSDQVFFDCIFCLVCRIVGVTYKVFALGGSKAWQDFGYRMDQGILFFEAFFVCQATHGRVEHHYKKPLAGFICKGL